MSLILYICVVLLSGWLLLRALLRQSLPLFLSLPLSIALGFALTGFYSFFLLLVFKQFHHVIFLTGLLVPLGVLFWINTRIKAPWLPLMPAHRGALVPLIPAAVITLLVSVAACHFPQGGWDAWSCWNFKAKFLYLAQDRWRDMLDAALWRSNNHYPLLWPLINAAGCFFTGSFTTVIPQINSVILATMTTLLLSQTLLTKGLRPFLSALLPLLGFSIPLVVILSASQYSDLPVALFITIVFACLLLKNNFPRLVLVAGVITGSLAFLKTEGLAAAVILAGIGVWQLKEKDRIRFLSALLICSLPAIVFQWFMAPPNSAFINGILSKEKPLTLNRLALVAIYPWLEIISLKWLGFWCVAGLSVGLNARRAFTGTLAAFPVFLLLYLGSAFAYYALNTFFPVMWWMQTTLHRILFTLIPIVLLWLGLSLRKDA